MGIEIPANPKRYQRLGPTLPRLNLQRARADTTGAEIVGGIADLGKLVLDQTVRLADKMATAEATTKANQSYRNTVLEFQQMQSNFEKDSDYDSFQDRFTQRTEEIYAKGLEGLSPEAQREYDEMFQNERVKQSVTVSNLVTKKKLAYMGASLERDLAMGVESMNMDYVTQRIASARQQGVLNAEQAEQISTKAKYQIHMKQFIRDARSLGLENGAKWAAIPAREGEYEIEPGDRQRVSNLLEWEFRESQAKKTDALERATAAANSKAVDYFKVGALTFGKIDQLFDPVAMADRKQFWTLKVMDDIKERQKGEKEEYVTDEATLGRLIRSIHGEGDRKFIMAQITAALDKGLEKEKNGISIDDYTKLISALDKYKPEPSTGKAAMKDYARETAFSTIEKNKEMTQTEKYRAINALNNYVLDMEAKGQVVKEETLIEFSRNLTRGLTDEKLKVRLREQVLPITGPTELIPETVLAGEKREMAEQKARAAEMSLEEKNTRIMAIDAFKRETMQNPDQEWYMPEKKLWAFRLGDVWYSYDKQNKKMYTLNMKDKKPEWK